MGVQKDTTTKCAPGEERARGAIDAKEKREVEG